MFRFEERETAVINYIHRIYPLSGDSRVLSLSTIPPCALVSATGVDGSHEAPRSMGIVVRSAYEIQQSCNLRPPCVANFRVVAAKILEQTLAARESRGRSMRAALIQRSRIKKRGYLYLTLR